MHDIELGGPEGRRYFVLDNPDAGAAAYDIGARFDGLDAAYIETDRTIEFQRPAARSGFGIAKDNANLFPELVGEDQAGIGLFDRSR